MCPLLRLLKKLGVWFNLSRFNPTTSTSQSDIKHQITHLQEFLQSTDYFNHFACFLEKLSAADSTCTFWVQFVCHDTLAYVGLYLEVIGTYAWLLKLMAPVFSAFNHFT